MPNRISQKSPFAKQLLKNKGQTGRKSKIGNRKSGMLAGFGSRFPVYVYRPRLPEWIWQMATARASAASRGTRSRCRDRSARTIERTCGFSALP
jgi:hypothetical protein